MALHNPYSPSGHSDQTAVVGAQFDIAGADMPGATGAGTKYSLQLGGFPVGFKPNGIRAYATSTSAGGGTPGAVLVSFDEATLTIDGSDPTQVDVDAYVSLAGTGVTPGTIHIWVW